VGNTRSEEQNTTLYSDLVYKWNILEPINGLSLNILGNMILYPIWASPRNMHIRVPHVGMGPDGAVATAGFPCEVCEYVHLYIYISSYLYMYHLYACIYIVHIYKDR